MAFERGCKRFIPASEFHLPKKKIITLNRSFWVYFYCNLDTFQWAILAEIHHMCIVSFVQLRQFNVITLKEGGDQVVVNESQTAGISTELNPVFPLDAECWISSDLLRAALNIFWENFLEQPTCLGQKKMQTNLHQETKNTQLRCVETEWFV